MRRLSRSLSKRFSRSSRTSKSERASGDDDGGGDEGWFPGLQSGGDAGGGLSSSSTSALSSPPDMPRRSASFISVISRRSGSSFRPANSSDTELKQHTASVVYRQRELLTTLDALDRERVAAAANHDHDALLASQAFQDALRDIQSCQRQQQALLAHAARVQALCPTDYPELLRLSVELMTTFSRVAAKPEEAAPQSITDGGNLRQRSLSATL